MSNREMVKYSDKELDDLMCEYGPYFYNINDINKEELELVRHFRLRFVDRTRTLNQKNQYRILSEVPTGTINKSFTFITI